MMFNMTSVHIVASALEFAILCTALKNSLFSKMLLA